VDGRQHMAHALDRVLHGPGMSDELVISPELGPDPAREELVVLDEEHADHDRLLGISRPSVTLALVQAGDDIVGEGGHVRTGVTSHHARPRRVAPCSFGRIPTPSRVAGH